MLTRLPVGDIPPAGQSHTLDPTITSQRNQSRRRPNDGGARSHMHRRAADEVTDGPGGAVAVFIYPRTTTDRVTATATQSALRLVRSVMPAGASLRQHGGAFVILLPDTRSSECWAIGESLRSTLLRAFPADGRIAVAVGTARIRSIDRGANAAVSRAIATAWSERFEADELS